MSPPTSPVPRIETGRLLLRELRLADFEAYAAHVADPIASKHTGGSIDRRTAWRMFCAATGGWLITGAGWWAIELRDTGEMTGLVGAFFRENALPAAAGADIELGWSLFSTFWRRGIATEAARAALDHAFAAHPRSPRAIAYISVDNPASVAVGRALGMTFEGDVDFYGESVGRYAVARPGSAGEATTQ